MKLLKADNIYFVRIENKDEYEMIQQKRDLACLTEVNYVVGDRTITKAYFCSTYMKTLSFKANNDVEDILNLYKEVLEDIEFKDITNELVDKEVLMVCGGKSIHVYGNNPSGVLTIVHTEDNISLSATQLIDNAISENTLAVRF